MEREMQFFSIFLLAFASFDFFINCYALPIRRYDFVVKEVAYTRLCKTKRILTVNGKFPGPTLHVHRGDTIIVNVDNKGKQNITIHWHGVRQPRNPWSDGPEYITQCPIQPGKSFKQKVIFSTEEGTLWWHAHSDWSRATVYGAIFVYPKFGSSYPFPKPHQEVPIILGEWWKRDVRNVLNEALKTGRNPRVSNAYTINGQPGDLYLCSKQDTFRLKVEQGKTYLLRMINAGLMDIHFVAIAKHNLTAVAADGSYIQPLTKEYIIIAPGQTLDCLLQTNQSPGQYYIAASAYSTGVGVEFDETTTTAVLEYDEKNNCSRKNVTPSFPYLPSSANTTAAFNILREFRSLHPISLKWSNTSTKLMYTISINTLLCPKNRCQGPNGTRLAASMNNISFENPSKIDILQAYYKRKKGVFGDDFPSGPPLAYNYTADYQDLRLEATKKGTKVKVLHYNTEVEVVFQGTSVVAGLDHPMHLHGYSFYVVGWGFGNFDKEKDPLTYNLVDPPLQNTVVVPKNGWAAIRFKADNPGVWFMHCHLERHQAWGMDTVFIVRNGKDRKEKILPPPLNMPPC